MAAAFCIFLVLSALLSKNFSKYITTSLCPAWYPWQQFLPYFSMIFIYFFLKGIHFFVDETNELLIPESWFVDAKNSILQSCKPNNLGELVSLNNFAFVIYLIMSSMYQCFLKSQILEFVSTEYYLY